VETAVLAVSLVPAAAPACTTFCWESDGSLLFGKNYDWSVEAGLLVVNQRGVQKSAETLDRPARWTSRFGSITFDQYGREFPCGGMNERGLVMELMWLDDTRYPPADARPALPTLQWIQYQLDTAATVDDVVASDRSVRIAADGSAKIHFLVADAGGDVAAIEFLDGRMVVHRGAEMPFRVLANDTYARSLAYARAIDLDGAALGRSSLDRFARAARRTARPPAPRAASIDDAFALLADVAQAETTQWSIVYAIGARRVYFRTRSHRAVRWIDLDGLSWECDAPARILPLDAPVAGDAAPFLVEYTPAANLAVVRAAFAGTSFLRDLPAQAHAEHARYPETTRCAP
jgi:choloylglycine hydrolase